MIDQRLMHRHDVGNGEERKFRSVRHARFGVLAGRTGRSLTSAQNVGADDKVAIRVDSFAGADEAVPPAGLAFVRLVSTRHMGVAGEGMTDEDRIVAGGRELP